MKPPYWTRQIGYCQKTLSSLPRPITLDELYEIKQGKREPKGKEVVITFDDGNESYSASALPILTKFQISSANFLVAESVTKRLHGSMDLETVRELTRNPLVTFGSHTLTHPVLTEVDSNTAEKEILESKTMLEGLLDQEISYFTYPTGVVDERSVSLVEDAGYRLAFTTSWKKLAEPDHEILMALPRTKIHPDDNLLYFWIKITGLTYFAERLFARIF